MPINQNHLFEELNGVKCAIVEKNASKERVAFLKELLETNQFEVVVVPSPPPKVAPALKPVATSEGVAEPQTSNTEPQTQAPETFTIGVTNVSFNPTNAIFGRLLRTKGGHIVTQAYWYQKESVSNDEIPYYESKV